MALPFAKVYIDPNHLFPNGGDTVKGKIKHSAPKGAAWTYSISTDNDAITQATPPQVTVPAGQTESNEFALSTDAAIAAVTRGYVYAAGGPPGSVIPRQAQRIPVVVYPVTKSQEAQDARPAAIMPIGNVKISNPTVQGGNQLQNNRLERNANDTAARSFTVTTDNPAITSIVNSQNAGKGNVVDFAQNATQSEPFVINTTAGASPAGGYVYATGSAPVSPAALDVT